MSSAPQERKTLHWILAAALAACAWPCARAETPAAAGTAGGDEDWRFTLTRAAPDPRRPDRPERADLTVDATVRAGRWCADVYAFAPALGNAEHYGRLMELAPSGDVVRAAIHLQINAPEPGIRGEAFYGIVLTRKGDTLTGYFRGRAGGRSCDGSATGTVRAVSRPRGFAPPAAGEHPRLLARHGTLAGVRKRNRSEPQRSLIADLRAMPDDPLAAAAVHAATGEDDAARKALALIERAQKQGSPGRTPDAAEALALHRQALAFDLIHDAIEESARVTVAARLRHDGTRMMEAILELPAADNSPMAVYLVGAAHAAIAATWDSPGSLPVRPWRPVSHYVPAPLEVPRDETVPVHELRSGATATAWLFAAPFLARADQYDGLALAPGDAGPDSRAAFSSRGQDYLEDLGGTAAARPTAGVPVRYGGQSLPFQPLRPDAMTFAGDHVAVNLWAAHRRVPCSAGYYYTLVRGTGSGWYQILLAPPASANEPYPSDAVAFLNGVALRHQDLVQMDRGVYPLMVRATTEHPNSAIAPRFVRLTEAETHRELDRLQIRYRAASNAWASIMSPLTDLPLYRIAERKARRSLAAPAAAGPGQAEAAAARRRMSLALANLGGEAPQPAPPLQDAADPILQVLAAMPDD